MGFSKRSANSHCPGVAGHWPATSEAVMCAIYIMTQCWGIDEHSVGCAHSRCFHCADYSRLYELKVLPLYMGHELLVRVFPFNVHETTIMIRDFLDMKILTMKSH